jgi:Zn-dependent peptidase ImmA (M78 family)
MSPTHEQIVREASLSAQREIARLGLDETRRIEVFDIIEHEGIWLMFQPLERVYGLYKRLEGTAGIAIHAGHPWGLQRFTAAHEYGHHVLRHDESVDTADEIESRSEDPLELAAQAFAATFLMPVQLVNLAIRRLGLPHQPGTMTPEQVYEFSLELGSSYTAAVTQLRSLGKLNWQAAQRLLKQSPLAIKEALGGGERPANARADVWLLDEDDDERQLAVRIDDEIDVRLPEVPTSGYRWIARLDGRELTDHEDTMPLVTVKSRLEPVEAREPRRYGGERQRRLRLRAIQAGDVELDLVLVQPWLGPGAEPLRQLRAHVHVVPPRTGDAPQGVSVVQQPALLAA